MTESKLSDYVKQLNFQDGASYVTWPKVCGHLL
uniref:Uncharacterized protein n=1 Tax=Anguilla anguilla TaxID=7936 RepID=A0A0E9TC82_ANGAN